MNDAPMGELGDPGPVPGRKRRGRASSKSKAKSNVVPLKAGSSRKPAIADPEMDEQMEKEQPGRNSHGIEGRENAYRSFILDAAAHEKQMGTLRMKWASRVKEAKEAGVNTQLVKQARKEIKEDIDDLVQQRNLLNRIREMIYIPADPQLPALSAFGSETEQDKKADEAGRRTFWRPGSERDCPYDKGTPRWNIWVTAFREEEATARGLVSASTMKALASKPAAE